MKLRHFYMSMTGLFLCLCCCCYSDQATDVKSSVADLKNLVEEFNFNFEDGIPTFTNFFQRLMRHCQKSNVNIDLKSLLSAYSCLGSLNNTLGDVPSDDPLSDSLYEKICTQWPETKECIQPIVAQLEICLFAQFMEVNGVLIDILDTLKKPFCTADTKFFDDIIGDIPPTFTCMTSHLQAIINDAVECFTRSPENKHVKQSDSKQICRNFDHYMKCFDVCDNRRVGKLVYKLVEDFGFKKIFYNRVFRCS